MLLPLPLLIPPPPSKVHLPLVIMPQYVPFLIHPKIHAVPVFFNNEAIALLVDILVAK
jgi:hypothetical protein